MKGLLLISGGIDSPVAGHFMQQVGVELEAVHFSSEPFTDDTPEKKSRELCKILGIENLHVVNISKQLKEMVDKCNRKYYFVLAKREMLRQAEKIAKERKCQFLVTGENLAQVSSQTLSNLVTIDRAVGIPVFRPLLGFDKVEIVNIAEEIGTYESSKGPEFCDVLGPKRPATKSTEEKILEEEKKFI
jgi:thiamine biosynthesis protein ThiI